MAETELKNYVVVPRQIAADYRNGFLSRSERDVYLWMRINANPYGIAYMSLETVADDALGSSKKKNYANKILLSLKEKRYIFYEDRSGRRGSFEVHFGDWLIPKGGIKQLTLLFEAAAVRRKKLLLTKPHSGDYAEDELQFQKFESTNQQSDKGDSPGKDKSTFRAHDNDTENETENETNHRFSSRKSHISFDDFLPRSYEEEMCVAFASELGEHDLAFILGSLKKYGIQVIEEAFKRISNAIKKQQVDNPRRLFNYLVQQVAEERNLK